MKNMCQSCGMPLSQDPQSGGTNTDGSKSTKYCSYCFQEGKFFNPDFTVKEMQEFCIGKMKEMGMPGWKAWLFSRGIPRLERWRA